MDTDRITGAAKETIGKAEAGIGDAFGDRSTQASGYARQAEGTAQNVYGQAKDTARDAAQNVFGDQLSDATDSAQRALNSLEAEVKARPLIALLIAALIGYVLAQLTTR